MEEKHTFFQSLTPENQNLFREWGSLFSLTNNPPPENEDIGAIVMPTGDWLDRLRPSLNEFRAKFNRQTNKPHFVITGGNSFDVNREGASAEKIANILLRLNNLTAEERESIIAEGDSANTAEQAKRVYEMIKSGQIKEPLVIAVSAYHLPRVISTFVGEVLRNEGENIRTKIFALPVYKDWKGEIPFEPEKIRREQIAPEMERIHRYREKGDVATEEDLRRYVLWLRNQLKEEDESQEDKVVIYENGNNIEGGLKEQIIRGYHDYFPPEIWEGRDPNDWFEIFNTDSSQPVRFVQLENGKVVSHVVVISRETNQEGINYKVAGLGGVYTDENHRKRGLGGETIGRAMDYMREENYDIGMLFCMPPLVDYYQKLGWEVFTGGPSSVLVGKNRDEAKSVAEGEVVMVRYISKKAQDHKKSIEKHPLFVGEEW